MPIETELCDGCVSTTGKTDRRDRLDAFANVSPIRETPGASRTGSIQRDRICVGLLDHVSRGTAKNLFFRSRRPSDASPPGVWSHIGRLRSSSLLPRHHRSREDLIFNTHTHRRDNSSEEPRQNRIVARLRNDQIPRFNGRREQGSAQPRFQISADFHRHHSEGQFPPRAKRFEKVRLNSRPRPGLKLTGGFWGETKAAMHATRQQVAPTRSQHGQRSGL